MIRNVLFVCSQNRLRSPTAEQVFSGRRDIEVASAGTNHDAVQAADARTGRLGRHHLRHGKGASRQAAEAIQGEPEEGPVICLDIPDDYEFMDPALVRLLEDQVQNISAEGGATARRLTGSRSPAGAIRLRVALACVFFRRGSLLAIWLALVLIVAGLRRCPAILFGLRRRRRAGLAAGIVGLESVLYLELSSRLLPAMPAKLAGSLFVPDCGKGMAAIDARRLCNRAPAVPRQGASQEAGTEYVSEAHRTLRDRADRDRCPAARAGALSGGDADRQSRRHHAARAGNAGRRRHRRLRGHARVARAARPLRHPPATTRLSRAQCRRGRAEADRGAAGRAERGAGLGRRHAAGLRSRLPAGRRRRSLPASASCRCPAPPPCWRR